MSDYPLIYLASASPRRAELLKLAGVEFEKLVCSVDESALAGESAKDLVQRLASAKASAGEKLAEQTGKLARPVLGADTIVVVENKVLGKPESRGHAEEMLRALSDRSHEVMSAVAVYYQGSVKTTMSITRVAFTELREGQVQRYLDSDEPYDKAGAYGIQGAAGAFVRAINGSYSGVVGLPLAETCALLSELD